MAKLQNFRRILKESFPEEFRQLADFLGDSINSHAEDVINAFNKNITVDDNLNMQYKEIDLTVNASGVPIITTQYKSTLRTKVRGMSVIKVENLSNTASYLTGAPFVVFSENSQVITLTQVTGLNPNTKYKITILATG